MGAVSCTYIFGIQQLRTGDAKLKQTQEYPQKFCKKIRKLHLKYIAAWARKLFVSNKL